MNHTDTRVTRATERREGARKRVAVRVYVVANGERHRCQARNISKSGVFVETEEFFVVPGTRVELIFVLSGSHLVKMHRVRAVVARVCSSGAGIRLRAN